MAHGLIAVLLDFPQELRYLHILVDGKQHRQGLDKHTGCIRQPFVMASVVDRAEEALLLIQRLGQGIAKGTHKQGVFRDFCPFGKLLQFPAVESFMGGNHQLFGGTLGILERIIRNQGGSRLNTAELLPEKRLSLLIGAGLLHGFLID